LRRAFRVFICSGAQKPAPSVTGFAKTDAALNAGRVHAPPRGAMTARPMGGAKLAHKAGQDAGMWLIVDAFDQR
jgi:hypothetical protein